MSSSWDWRSPWSLSCGRLGSVGHQVGPQRDQQIAGLGGQRGGQAMIGGGGAIVLWSTDCRPSDSSFAGEGHLPYVGRFAMDYELTNLRALEAESIHIIREVAAEFERPVLLFSGGKDSVVMLHLASQGVLAVQAARSR